MGRRSVKWLAVLVKRLDNGISRKRGSEKMSDWRIRHKDADGRDAESTVFVRRPPLSKPYI